jgi:hypothetical protein
MLDSAILNAVLVLMLATSILGPVLTEPSPRACSIRQNAEEATMKLHTRHFFVSLLALVVGLSLGTETLAQTDSLASWNDGAAKQAIVEFVHATTDQSNPKFVPPEERIATFDQDGTLWVEHADVYAGALLPRPGADGRKAEAGTREGRAVQDRIVRQSGGDGKSSLWTICSISSPPR